MHQDTVQKPWLTPLHCCFSIFSYVPLEYGIYFLYQFISNLFDATAYFFKHKVTLQPCSLKKQNMKNLKLKALFKREKIWLSVQALCPEKSL